MQVYEEMTPQEVKAEEEEKAAVERRVEVPIVVVQAVVCIILLLAALALKYTMPALYGELRAQYDGEMARSVLIPYDNVSDI